MGTVHELAELLSSPLFTVAGTPVTWLETLAFVTGVANVWLLTRQHPANWPVGLVSVALYLLVFTGAGLYGDAALQLVYIVLSGYGWWAWVRRGPAGAGDQLRVSRTSRRTWWVLAGAGVLGTAALTWYLDAQTNSTVPFWDALTTAGSLLAIYGQTRKLVESWWLWIAVDVVYVPLYASRDLWLTAGLYLVFMALCVVGLRAWSRELASPVAPTPAGVD